MLRTREGENTLVRRDKWNSSKNCCWGESGEGAQQGEGRLGILYFGKMSIPGDRQTG